MQQLSKLSEEMKNLTDGIVLEILLRLPVKSLLRFRCVCKEWCSLIKSPLFIDRHLAVRRHLVAITSDIFGADHFSLNCYSGLDSFSFLPSTPDFNFHLEGHTSFRHVVGSVNGIVCFNEYDTILLLNPALREFRTLPPRPFACPTGLISGTSAFGFGFDDTTNDYKVVRLVYYVDFEGLHYTRAEVYNLRTNSWKDSGRVRNFVLQQEGDYYPIYLNGRVHWLACLWRDDFILGFNMTTETFQEDMQLPQGLSGQSSDRLNRLFVMDKCTIALVEYTYISEWSGSEFMNVWVMKEYGIRESWVKQYSVIPPSRLWKPLSFWKKEKLVILGIEGELVFYDLSTGELHQLQKHDHIDATYTCSVEMVTCDESLFSIKQVLE